MNIIFHTIATKKNYPDHYKKTKRKNEKIKFSLKTQCIQHETQWPTFVYAKFKD